MSNHTEITNFCRVSGWIMLIGLVVGCTTNIETKSEGEQSLADQKKETASIKKNMRSFSKNDANCSSNCTEVNLSYEEMEGNTRFNRALEKRVVEQLQYFVRNGERLKDLESVSTAFISDYREFKEAFPESKTPWNLSVEGEIKFTSDKLISYEMIIESYTGGAHTSREKLLFNVNKNGREISLKSLIKDHAILMNVAEKAFREEKGLDDTQDLAAAGYIFEGNRFQLPENIGFTPKGVILFYNDYEINSYSEGPAEVFIPFRDIKDALNIQS